jgi:hypothetical protein
MDAKTEIATALELYKASVQSLNALWSFFSVVSLGLVGFLAGGEKLSVLTHVFVGVAFSLFSTANHIAIAHQHGVLVAATEALRQYTMNGASDSYKELAQALKAKGLMPVRLFHIIFSVIVLVIILVICAMPGSTDAQKTTRVAETMAAAPCNPGHQADGYAPVYAQ